MCSLQPGYLFSCEGKIKINKRLPRFVFQSNAVLIIDNHPQIRTRKTRSSDFVSDWSTMKDMNRDLQPKNAKKRPVAEVTSPKMR